MLKKIFGVSFLLSAIACAWIAYTIGNFDKWERVRFRQDDARRLHLPPRDAGLFVLGHRTDVPKETTVSKEKVRDAITASLLNT